MQMVCAADVFPVDESFIARRVLRGLATNKHNLLIVIAKNDLTLAPSRACSQSRGPGLTIVTAPGSRRFCSSRRAIQFVDGHFKDKSAWFRPQNTKSGNSPSEYP